MIPDTIVKLESWMKENCYHFNNYSINGNSIHEGLGIDQFGGLYIWYYTERGKRENLKYFQTEKEIVEFAFSKIKSDKWAKSHCIGFTTDMVESKELANILKELDIVFFQDEIPYYGNYRLVYRTFVIGCDINTVSYLKNKYNKEGQ